MGFIPLAWLSKPPCVRLVAQESDEVRCRAFTPDTASRAASEFHSSYWRPKVESLLTYESISETVAIWGGRLNPLGLLRLETPAPPLGTLRAVFVPAAILEIFEGRHLHTGFPDVGARVQIGNFNAGYYLRASLVGDPNKRRPDVERLSGLDEVWVMCFRRPPPGWRLFGRFVAKNIFVGTALKDRHECGRRSRYTAIAESVIDLWNHDPFRLPVIRGSVWQDYLDGTVADVDN